MRILFITSNLATGGAERVVSVLANQLVSIGHEIGIVTVLGDEVKYKIVNAIDYMPIETKSCNKVFRIIERIRKIRRNIKRFNADIVISFATENNIYAITCSKFLPVKVIVSERNDPNNDPNSRMVRQLRDIIYNLSDGFVFQTEDAKKYFNNKIQSRSSVIPNPVNPIFKERRRIENRKNNIVAVCRLSKQKNLDLLIKSFFEISSDYSHLTLTLYGEGDEKNRLQKLVQDLHLNDKVIFAGFEKNIEDRIFDSLFYISTSNYEGISNSLLEAMSLGLAVIATDCPIGGTRMAIENNVNGLLIPVGDKDACVDAMRYLINNPKEIKRLGNEAKKISESWSTEEITKLWLDYIQRTANKTIMR